MRMMGIDKALIKKSRNIKVIIMTRCRTLDSWFDEQSKKVDETEKKTNKEFVTGKKIRRKFFRKKEVK